MKDRYYDGGYVDTDTKPYKIKGSDNSKRKIIITNDGKVTKAKYFDNENQMCIGVATCHENDTFDLFKGAELALERCHQAKKMILDKYCYEIAPGKIREFMDGDLAVECRLSQVVGFLKWCDEKGLDVSAKKSVEAYEHYMNYETVIFYVNADYTKPKIFSICYSKEYPNRRYAMSFYTSIISFDDFFKLPEGVSIG